MESTIDLINWWWHICTLKELYAAGTYESSTHLGAMIKVTIYVISQHKLQGETVTTQIHLYSVNHKIENSFRIECIPWDYDFKVNLVDKICSSPLF